MPPPPRLLRLCVGQLKSNPFLQNVEGLRLKPTFFSKTLKVRLKNNPLSQKRRRLDCKTTLFLKDVVDALGKKETLFRRFFFYMHGYQQYPEWPPPPPPPGELFWGLNASNLYIILNINLFLTTLILLFMSTYSIYYHAYVIQLLEYIIPHVTMFICIIYVWKWKINWTELWNKEIHYTILILYLY